MSKRERDWSVGPWSKGDRGEEYKAYVMLCPLPLRLLCRIGLLLCVVYR